MEPPLTITAPETDKVPAIAVLPESLATVNLSAHLISPLTVKAPLTVERPVPTTVRPSAPLLTEVIADWVAPVTVSAVPAVAAFKLATRAVEATVKGAPSIVATVEFKTLLTFTLPLPLAEIFRSTLGSPPLAAMVGPEPAAAFVILISFTAESVFPNTTNSLPLESARVPSKFATSVPVLVNAKSFSKKLAPLAVSAILNFFSDSSKPINALLCVPRLMMKPESFTGNPVRPFCKPSKVSE